MKFTGKGTFYGVCSRAGVVSVGGWLASNSDVWTTVATGLPPAAISTFIVVPTDANNNAMKARVTQSGTLDIRLIKPSAVECYGDFNIAYIAKQLSLSRKYPSIDSRNLKSIYFQVYDDGSRYHFQAIVKMKNGLAKTLTLITWQQLSLSQLNDKTFFWGGLNKFDVGFYGANDDFSLEFGFVSFIDNRKMILIFNKYGIELQFLNSDNTNRRTIWKMTAKQLSLSQKTTMRTTQGTSLIQFDWGKRADGTLSLIVVIDGIKAIELLPSWPEQYSLSQYVKHNSLGAAIKYNPYNPSEVIMVENIVPNDSRYLFCVTKDGIIQLWDGDKNRAVWTANLTRLYQ